MNQRNYPVLTVTDKAERALRAGHPWVYGEEVTATAGTPENGGIVDVCNRKGRYLGSGFYNDISKIRVRILSRCANDRYDDAFFSRKVAWAVAYRRTVMGEDYPACRLIFGEADGFPGLTVDRFGDVLVTEVLCYGMEQRKAMLYDALRKELANDGVTIRVIYERSDSPLRKKEGLEPFCGFFDAPGLETSGDGEITITENGIAYAVNFITGQKTGFFLDQKYNRRAAARLAPGRYVLDCFTHTGSFALNAARAGAAHVTAVDISAEAVKMAEENARRNGLAKTMDFRCADVFDFLTALAENGKSPYDYIILDPPAFTKSNATVKAAYRGYKEINLKAMKLLPRGGYLATCSCSHFMTDELFRRMLAEAAADAGVSLRQIEGRRQSPDHPILWGVPETEYLKFYLFQVV